MTIRELREVAQNMPFQIFYQDAGTCFTLCNSKKDTDEEAEEKVMKLFGDLCVTNIEIAYNEEYGTNSLAITVKWE